MTHTPAPWRYEAATKTIRAVPSNYWLASMNSWDGAVEHEANAHLIAAAPEMLEALAQAWAEIDAWRRGLNNRNMNKCKVGAAFVEERTVRGAINKARGRTS